MQEVLSEFTHQKFDHKNPELNQKSVIISFERDGVKYYSALQARIMYNEEEGSSYVEFYYMNSNSREIPEALQEIVNKISADNLGDIDNHVIYHKSSKQLEDSKLNAVFDLARMIGADDDDISFYNYEGIATSLDNERLLQNGNLVTIHEFAKINNPIKHSATKKTTSHNGGLKFLVGMALTALARSAGAEISTGLVSATPAPTTLDFYDPSFGSANSHIAEDAFEEELDEDHSPVRQVQVTPTSPTVSGSVISFPANYTGGYYPIDANLIGNSAVSYVKPDGSSSILGGAQSNATLVAGAENLYQLGDLYIERVPQTDNGLIRTTNGTALLNVTSLFTQGNGVTPPNASKFGITIGQTVTNSTNPQYYSPQAPSLFPGHVVASGIAKSQEFPNLFFAVTKNNSLDCYLSTFNAAGVQVGAVKVNQDGISSFSFNQITPQLYQVGQFNLVLMNTRLNYGGTSFYAPASTTLNANGEISTFWQLFSEVGRVDTSKPFTQFGLYKDSNGSYYLAWGRGGSSLPECRALLPDGSFSGFSTSPRFTPVAQNSSIILPDSLTRVQTNPTNNQLKIAKVVTRPLVPTQTPSPTSTATSSTTATSTSTATSSHTSSATATATGTSSATSTSPIVRHPNNNLAIGLGGGLED